MLSADKTGGAKPTVQIGYNSDKAGTNKEFRVNFFGAKYEVELPRPTESQVALYATAGDNGYWLPVLEQAYIKALRDSNVNVVSADFFAGFFSNDAYRGMEKGQLLQAALAKFSSRKPDAVIARGQAAWTENSVNAKLKDLRGAVDANGWAPLKVIVTAGVNQYTGYDPADTTMLPAGHAYAVIGYKDSTKELRIVNPWNSAAYTFGQTFEMKTTDFVAKFSQLCIESRIGVNAP